MRPPFLLPVLLLLLLGVAACPGPRPLVERVDLHRPTAPDAPYVVAVTVRNDGRGEGEAQVTVRLEELDSGASIVEERNVMLEGHGTASVAVPFFVPRGTYVPKAHVEYPPK